MVKNFGNLAEAAKMAKRILPPAVWLAVKAGNEAQWTLGENVNAFTSLGFTPTIFDRPTSFDLKRNILGVDIDFPVMVSPVGAQAIHPDNESGAAAAAHRLGTAMGLSSWASDPLEKVIAANPNVFFQLYWTGTRQQILDRVRRAKQLGAKALIVTLDWSHTPRRDHGVPPAPPTRMDFKTMMQLAPHALSRPYWLSRYLVRGSIPEIKVPNLWTGSPDNVPTFGAAWSEFERTAAPTEEDVKWLRKEWDGPFMVKGIMTVRDALVAKNLGADAIGISNHGGNNIDVTPSPMRFLPAIREAVGDSVQVIVDGGIRRGSDVVKAICLGADAAFVGRAYLYGLAISGSAGVQRVLEILRDGVRETMFGIGHSSLDDLSLDDLIFLKENFLLKPSA